MKLSVLIAEDDALVRATMNEALEAASHVVHSVPDGKEAMSRITQTRYDVIISDVGMAGMDGYQLMRKVRLAEAPTGRIPAIALTAFAHAEDRKRAILAGYQSHVAKPFDMAELVIVVAGLLGRT